MGSQIIDVYGAGKPTGCSTSQLRSALDEVFQEPIDAVIERETTAFDLLLDKCGKRCVLFGAGSLGRQALVALKTIGIRPVAISDNNPKLWNTAVDEIPLLSPEDAAQRYGKDSVFFITIRNEHHSYLETVAQLKQLGCETVSSADPISWRLPGSLQPQLLYDLPHKLYQQPELVYLGADLWADDQSRADYLGNVRLRALGDRSWFPKPASEGSYFVDDAFELRSNEVYLDCGAFDGDTIRALLERKAPWSQIDAVEADRNSFAKLEAYVGTLDSSVRERIRLHYCAVGATRGVVSFDATGGLDARISTGGGGVLVDLLPIDELLGSRQVSFIKMDIEGAEVDAIKGSRQVIERDHPILAICIYHRIDDLWNIPLLIREIKPDYKMYLRNHGGDALQAVVYAVPADRVLGK